jgi:hypothetical protein
VPADWFDRFRVERRRRTIWVLERAANPQTEIDTGRFRVHAPGLRALRLKREGAHATNGFLRLLGPAIARNVVDLGASEAVELLHAERARVDRELAPGQLAIRVDGRVVGAAFGHGRTLHLQIPASWRPRPRGREASGDNEQGSPMSIGSSSLHFPNHVRDGDD